MFLILFILIIFIGFCEVYLLSNHHIPKKYTFLCFLFILANSILLTLYQGSSLSSVGIKSISLWDILIYSGVVILACLSIRMYISFKHIKRKKQIKKDKLNPFIFYFLLSAPTQEFLFRSFVFFSLDKLHLLNILTMVICSTFFFGYAHRMFQDDLLYKGSYGLGLILGIAYYFSPNLILSSVAHGLIGIYAYRNGLFKEKSFVASILPRK